MTRRLGILLAALTFLAAACATAQETMPGPGSLEVTVVPVGATFLTSGNGRAAAITSSAAGSPTTSIALSASRVRSAARSGFQSLQFGGLTGIRRTPHPRPGPPRTRRKYVRWRSPGPVPPVRLPANSRWRLIEDFDSHFRLLSE
jgi:hypothetical protein